MELTGVRVQMADVIARHSSPTSQMIDLWDSSEWADPDEVIGVVYGPGGDDAVRPVLYDPRFDTDD
jgi:hypothetical protein